MAEGVSGSLAEKKLTSELFRDYNAMIRPVKSNQDAVNVTFNMRFYQLIAIQEKEQVIEVAVWVRQSWNDYQLRWNPEDYNGIEAINVRPDMLWVPDIVLYNNVNDDNAEFGGNIDTLRTRVVVKHTGGYIVSP